MRTDIATLGALTVMLTLAGCREPTEVDRDADDGARGAIEPQATNPPAASPPPKAPAVAVQRAPVDFLSAPEYAFSKANVEALCTEEWTKRGALDQRMYAHCVRTETDAHGRFRETVKKTSSEAWLQDTLPAIWQRNTKRGITKYGQVAYLLDREHDKFLDYSYEVKQPGVDAAKLNGCAEANQRRHDVRWSQTMYCYKRD